MQVLTANRLVEGDVVFWGAGGWQMVIDQAVIVESEEAARLLERAGQGTVEANIVVEPYLIDVTRQSDRIVPVHYRERIRAAGPTVRADLGKQAQEAG